MRARLAQAAASERAHSRVRVLISGPFREARRAGASVELRQADAGVEGLQNLLVGEPGACEAVGADLTHPDAVPPDSPVEGVLRDAAALVELAVDDEELLAQLQGRADAAAAHVRRRRLPDYFEVEHAPRDAAPPHAQVEERAHVGDGARE